MISIVRGSRFLFALLIAVAASWEQPVSAGLVFLFTDDGTNTTVNWSGNLNTVGLTVQATAATETFYYVEGNPTPRLVAMDSSPKLRFDQPIQTQSLFATQAGNYAPTNVTGDNFGLGTFGADLFVPQGYVSGSPLGGSFQILGQTVASMGIVDTPNAFVLTNGDTVAVGVPEPSTCMLTGIAIAGGVGYRRLRRRAC